MLAQSCIDHHIVNHDAVQQIFNFEKIQELVGA